MARRTDQKGKLVVNSIVIRPNSRSVLDVGQWRTALKAADRGKRYRLYDMYDDIMLDPVVSAAVEKRILAITNAELVFKAANEQTRAEVDDLMESPEWEYLLREIMMAVFYGKSIVELDFSTGFSCYSIPRQHINTRNRVITVNPNDESGVPYTDDDFLVNVGRDDNLGLLLKVAPLAIYKRGGFGDWSQFVELFGMPRRIGKYSSHDDTSRKLLEEALEQAGSASWMVVPKETDVETQTTTASQGSTTVYREFRDACNEEILIGILGQTMTTQDGSSRSQSETHKEVEESINKADRRFVQRVLNTILLPRLAKRGYPVEGGYFYFAEAGESISLKDQLDMDVRLVNELGVALDDDYFYETYGRPRPKQAKRQAPREQGDDRLGWIDRVVRFFVGAPFEGATRSYPTCQDCGGTHHYDLTLGANEHDDDGLLKRVAEGRSSYFDAELFLFTSGALINGLQAGFLSKNFADISYGFEPDALKTAMELNLFQFSAAKTLAEVQKLNELWRGSAGFEEFKAKAEQVTQVFNKIWLRTEYDTAYHVAESSVTYYRLIGKSDIFPYWEYRTVGDDRVRDEHAILHGSVFPVNDVQGSVWNKIYPPNGWNCRCYVVPRMMHEVNDELIKSSRGKLTSFYSSKEWEQCKRQGFAVNRAKEGYVFDSNQSYIKRFFGNEGKFLDRINYTDFNLQPVSNLVSSQHVELPNYSGTAEDWANAHRVDGVITLPDHRNRRFTISDDSFRLHATDKKESRVELLTALEETLRDPNEIWINSYKSNRYDTYVYLKYYKHTAMIAIGVVKNGKITLKTWFKLFPTKLEEKYRRGLLIKK